MLHSRCLPPPPCGSHRPSQSPRQQSIVGKAKALMASLQEEAKQRALATAAEKEQDPIYGFIANVGAANKQVGP